MADHKITDFVDQSAIDGLARLKSEMVSVKDTYLQVAQELVKGLKVPIEGMDQLENLIKKLAELQGQAASATQRHAAALDEQNRIAANTTNTISRQLMEQEKLNETTRTAYTRQKDVKEILTQAVSSYGDMTKRLAEISISQDQLNERKRKEKKLYEEGKITQEQYATSLQNIIKQQQALAAEKSQLEAYTRSEAKENANSSSSYNAMSQELLRLKKAYRELDEEGRNTEIGQNMLAEIKELGAHLKDMDASMGDFHRNVGDYAIACNNGVVVTDDLNRVLGLQAGTIAGCIEQNKELEKAKLNLSTSEANYGEMLDRINAKIEENKRRIADVDAILNKEATSVAEAEAQNKQLAEALKLIDFRSADATKRIADINAKIEENKRVIERATPALQDQTKAIEAQKKASAGLVDQLGGLIGVNNKFGNSLMSLGNAAKGGSVIEGLEVKIKAFGQTLMGLLSNPWVLTFLGIAGVAAGFKWWYDYNKGLIEATRLTKDFTGKSGDDLKNFRSEVIAVADTFGKDFKEVLNATDKMATQLGISYEEALNSIKDGFLANADAQGNFLAEVEKFAPALRDAGLSAKEMVAIISQTRSGVFSEEGLKAIQVASDRIKRMPNATAEALDAIGMSHKEIQKALTEGTMTMMDVIQQASAKIGELPENSQEVGDAVYNLFGRKAAAGGLLLVESLADINTNLDEEKAKMGELATIQEEQLNSQIELEKTLSALFDATGGSFEKMKAHALTFVNKGLTAVIKGAVDIINWFIRLYNQSIVVRSAFNSIVNSFKTIWEVCKLVVNQVIDAFKALGTVIEGVLTLDVDKIASGYKKGLNALKANVTEMVKNIMSNTNDAIKNTINDQMEELTVNLGSAESGTSSDTGGNTNRTGKYTAPGLTDKEKKELEKKAKEQLKILNDLDEAIVNAMEDSHEKELDLIRIKFKKKISEIKGNSAKEQELRLALLDEMERDLANCEQKYQDNMMKINYANRMAAVKKHSQKEYDIKAQQLEDAYELEKREAKKNGADLSLIELKYEQQRRQLREEYAGYRMKDIQDRVAGEQAIADNAYNRQMVQLKQQLQAELETVGNNAEEREAIKRKYERKMAVLSEEYAQQTIKSNIDMVKEILKNEDLSAEERAKLLTELTKLEISLEDAKADAVAAANERILEDDKRTTEKRMENAQQWLQVAADGLDAINGLASAIFDAQVQRIDEQLEATKAAGDEEQEYLSELVDKKVISQEEGEARKRAAEAETAKKTEELEKKKQELKHKQAVWDKANSVAQAGIATALAIMNALQMQPFPVGIAMAAIAGAMGAVQIATILATPIPKYAKGTDYHKGGLAVVGDGGRSEVVSFGGQMYITPDTPTLVDMPRGAEVFPDADKLIGSLDLIASGNKPDTPKIIVNNDYSGLQREVVGIGNLIKRQTRAQQRMAYHSDYEHFKALRGL